MKKRIFKIIILIFFIILLMPKREIKAEMIIDNYQEINEEYENIEYYDQKANYKLLVLKDKIICFYQDKRIEIIESYVKHLFNNDELYLLTKTKLIKINNGVLIKELQIDNKTINNLYLDNYLYLVGSKDNNLYLMELDTSFYVLREYYLEDPVDAEIVNIIKVDNYFYCLIKRTHQDMNSIFKNVGNYFDEKTCLIKFDKRFNIINILYLNLDEEKELPKYLSFASNKLYLAIESNSYDYCFSVNLDLENLILEKQMNKQTIIMLDYNNDFLGFTLDHYLKIEAKDNNYDLDIELPIAVKIEDDELRVYTKKLNKIFCYKISEYHINKLNNFQIGFDYGNYDFNSDLNNTDAVDIKSYFTKVEVFNLTKFEKTISGIFDIELNLKIAKMPDIKLANKVEIENYCNIQDGHVYPIDTILYFLGSGILDNKTISSGYLIKNEGEHNLVIKDNQNNVFNYKFYVVKNYYAIFNNYQKIDYFVSSNEEFKIMFDLKDIIPNQIKEVIINNKAVEFNVSDNYLIINARGASSYGISHYILNSIKTEKKDYQINKEFNVLTKKSVPSIDFTEDETDELSLDLNINDPDQAILYFKIVTNNEEFKNFIVDETYSVLNNTSDIKIFVYYDLGDGKIESEEILNIKGNVLKGNNFIDFKIERTSVIKTIKLSFKTKNMESIEKISAGPETLNYDYVVKNNYYNIVLSIIISILIITVIVTIGIYKIKKKKKQ